MQLYICKVTICLMFVYFVSAAGVIALICKVHENLAYNSGLLKHLLPVH